MWLQFFLIYNLGRFYTVKSTIYKIYLTKSVKCTMIYKKNTEVSRVVEGSGPTKPDNLLFVSKVSNPAACAGRYVF